MSAVITQDAVDAVVAEIGMLYAELAGIVAERDAVINRCIANGLQLLELVNEIDGYTDALAAFKLAKERKALRAGLPVDLPAPVASLPLRATRLLKRKRSGEEEDKVENLPKSPKVAKASVALGLKRSSSRPGKLDKTAKASVAARQSPKPTKVAKASAVQGRVAQKQAKEQKSTRGSATLARKPSKSQKMAEMGVATGRPMTRSTGGALTVGLWNTRAGA
ncbi:hypothetical protein FB451DRAFT_1559261 [Mycena latifolia]|nr:hypothetical protein FB451DRAFT_1559261 [Mycena latifolia]